jgi:hypothetical protein
MNIIVILKLDLGVEMRQGSSHWSRESTCLTQFFLKKKKIQSNFDLTILFPKKSMGFLPLFYPELTCVFN